MSACLLVAGKPLMLASALFTLGWRHSVEKTQWVEHWRIEGEMLVLESARVKGSGAGMEPGEDARLENGWWVWPVNRAQSGVELAASGTTGGGWTLCAAGQCRVIGQAAGVPLSLSVCPPRDAALP